MIHRWVSVRLWREQMAKRYPLAMAYLALLDEAVMVMEVE